MWSVAESGNPIAAEDFQRRFPDLGHELSRRMLLVKELRGAKALYAAPALRPPFFPKPATPAAPWFKPALSNGSWVKTAAAIAVCAIGLAAFAFAALYSARLTTPPSNTPVSGAAMPNCPVKPGRNPKIVQSRSLPGPSGPTVRSPIPVTADQVRKQINATGTADHMPFYGQTGGDDGGKDSATRPEHVQLRQVPLKAAIGAIEGQCAVQIETAPDLPNPTIDADYENQSAIEILQDLGQKYGFGVVQEGDARFLLVPKK